MSDNSEYAREYSEGKFWAKIRKIKAIAFLVELAMKLYEILTSPDTPAWVKSICIAALGYLISPFDLIFDFIPGLGYMDDAAVLSGAVAAISSQWRKV